MCSLVAHYKKTEVLNTGSLYIPTAYIDSCGMWKQSKPVKINVDRMRNLTETWHLRPSRGYDPTDYLNTSCQSWKTTPNTLICSTSPSPATLWSELFCNYLLPSSIHVFTSILWVGGSFSSCLCILLFKQCLHSLFKLTYTTCILADTIHTCGILTCRTSGVMLPLHVSMSTANSLLQ